MSRKPTYYPQAFEFSCIPACIRMVLSAYELEIPEYRLRDLCRYEPDGTSDSDAIEAAKKLGFEDSYSAYLGIGDLRDLLSGGIFPIAIIRINIATHALVVTAIRDGRVFILDPADPERTTLEESSFVDVAFKR